MEKYCSETFVKPQNASDISPEWFPTRLPANKSAFSMMAGREAGLQMRMAQHQFRAWACQGVSASHTHPLLPLWVMTHKCAWMQLCKYAHKRTQSHYTQEIQSGVIF